MNPSETIAQLEAENQRLRAQVAALALESAAPALPWFDQVNDAIFVVDLGWQIQQWNHAAEQIYGWPRDQVLNHFINDIIPVQHYLDFPSELAAASELCQKGIWRSRFVQRARDGRELVIDGSMRAISDQHGALAGYIGINRDITERHKAQQKLRVSEERFRAVVENSAEGVLLLGPDAQISYISQTVSAILGYSLEQLHAGRPHELTHPDDLPGFLQFMEQICQTPGTSGQITIRAQRQDGSWCWLEQHANNQLDNPAIHSIVVNLRDVTERVQSEQALREQARVLEHALVLVRDMGSRIQLWTQGAEQLYGYTKAEALGRISHDLLQTKFPIPLDELSAALQATGRWSGTLVHRTRNGQPVTVASVWVLEYGADGQPWRIIEANTDITARVQAEQALQHTAERLALLRTIDRATLEAHAPATIAHTLLAKIRALLGCQYANILLYNQDRTVRTRFADNSEQLALLPPISAIGPDSHDTWQQFQRGEPRLIHDIAAAGHHEPISTLLSANQARALLRIPLLVQWQVIGTLNLASTTPGAFTDEHVAIAQEIGNTLSLALHNAQLVESLQQELAARTRAEQALVAEHTHVVQLKNEFMATMSHELRTPLTAVLGHTELLLEQVYGTLTPRQQTALERIARSGQSLLALINDILDYSKFEAGKIALSIGPTDVPGLCADSVQLVGEAMRAKNMSITIQRDAAVTLIAADGQRVQQMLLNLLTNAAKFSLPGGSVELEVRGDAERQQVTFLVRDQGIGIAPEDLGRLFQPFTQLDSRLSRQYEGTGLGLALVRRIAEAHGGSVGVESTLGKGSSFRVTLPWEPL